MRRPLINSICQIGSVLFLLAVFNSCEKEDIPYYETLDDQTNMPTTGVISAQYNDNSDGEGTDALLDNNRNTKFVTNNKSVWILWTGDSPTLLTQYSIFAANSDPESDPKDWTLYGSNNKENWVVLDVETNFSFESRFQKRTFDLQRVAPYQYYKLDITENNGSSKTQLSEWELIGEKSVNVATIFTECNYNGNSVNLGEGYYSSEALKAKGISDKTISSLEVEDGYMVILYDSILFKGTLLNLYLDVACLDSYGFDNATTSMVVKKFEVESMDDLMILATGNTYSSLTPMGTHYENLKTTTDDDKIWLGTASNQPSVPPGLASSLHWAKFNVSLYPWGHPSPADINQHSIGDCGGIAALASMAYMTPDFIESIITDNGDGTYTVSMYDPAGLPITVVVDSKFLTDSNGNIAAVSGKNDAATWSTVLEKAIMKYNEIYKANTTIEGIGSEHVLPLFTGDGESFAFDRNVLTADELARAVRSSLMQGKFVIGGFGKVISINDLQTVTAHAYTVMLTSVPHTLFAMRNPWGMTPKSTGGYDSSADGVLNIPATGDVLETIDLRIVNLGAAGSNGIFEAYTPPAGALKSVGIVRIPDARIINSGR